MKPSLFAKPLPFILPPAKPKMVRPSLGVNRMTIVAGFRCCDGAILCADTQETISGYAKREVDKITNWSVAQYGYTFAIGTAGSGNYADMLKEHLAGALRQFTSFDEQGMKAAITDSLVNFFSTHIWPRNSQDVPQIENLIVLHPTDRGNRSFPLLLHTAETAVNDVTHEPRCLGVGSYLAEFILTQYFYRYASKSAGLTMAAYMLKQVREHVEGCGKSSTIVYYGNDGSWEHLTGKRLKSLEETSWRVSDGMRDAFAYMTDVGDSDHNTYSHNPVTASRLLKNLQEVKTLNIEAEEEERKWYAEMKEWMRKQRTAMGE
jgi:20S proteasome alpha/beta subunit